MEAVTVSGYTDGCQAHGPGPTGAVELRTTSLGSSRCRRFRMRFPFVTPDGRYLMGNVGAFAGGMTLFSSTNGGNAYGAPVRYADPVQIDVPGSVLGIFPRYVPATDELFFNEWADNQGRNDIYIIKNFDPAAIKAAK